MKHGLSLAITTLVSLLILGCGGSSEAIQKPPPSPGSGAKFEPDPDAPWLPIAKRAAWVYKATVDGKPLPDRAFFCLDERNGGFVVEEYVGKRLLSQNNLTWTSEGWLMKPGGCRLLLSASPTLGNSWSCNGGSWNHARVIGTEQVFVPALGQSVNALRVDYSREVPANTGDEPAESGRKAYTDRLPRNPFNDSEREREGGEMKSFVHSRWWVRGVGVVRETTLYIPGDWTPPSAWPPKKSSYDFSGEVEMILASRDLGERKKP